MSELSWGPEKDELKPCPCGRPLDALIIEPGSTFRWRRLSGNCCGEWSIEVRVPTMEIPPDYDEMKWCIAKWNDAPRATAPQPDAELRELEREIATDSAKRDVVSYCHSETGEWWDTGSKMSEIEIAWVDMSSRYLELRGLLERHPERPELVRVKEEPSK